MSYNNLKHCQKLISKDNKLEKRYQKILNDLGRPYDCSVEVNHVSDALFANKKKIAEKL